MSCYFLSGVWKRGFPRSCVACFYFARSGRRTTTAAARGPFAAPCRFPLACIESQHDADRCLDSRSYTQAVRPERKIESPTSRAAALLAAYLSCNRKYVFQQPLAVPRHRCVPKVARVLQRNCCFFCHRHQNVGTWGTNRAGKASNTKSCVFYGKRERLTA